MRTFAACLLVVGALAAEAHAGPKVLIVTDGDTTNAQAMTSALNALGTFSQVDSFDANSQTPTLAQLQAYDAVAIWQAGFLFSDPIGLGNTLAQFVDGGGGVVQLMFDMDGADGLNLQGTWNTGGYDCLLDTTDFLQQMTLDYKSQPNDPNNPLVQGVVSGLEVQYREPMGLNTAHNAVSVWDYSDGTPAICEMTINGHPRVDLNFYPDASIGYSELSKGDFGRIVGNALLVVAGGGNPLSGSPSPLVFPDTGQGAVSSPMTVTYTNKGTQSLTVTALTIGGTNPGDFAFSNLPTMPLTVAPNTSFTTALLFQPSAGGARSAILKATVTGQMSTADVALQGKGIPAAIKATPNPVAFGSTTVGNPLTKQVTLFNQGTVTVSVTDISVSTGNPPFSLVSPPQLPISLNPGASIPITVQYAPTVDGTSTGVLTIKSNDTGTPTLNVALAGCAGPGQLTLDAASIAFGNVNVGAAASSAVTATNTGCSDITFDMNAPVALSGANPGDYTVDATALTKGPLGAGASAQFLLTFKPTTTGSRTATATVNAVINSSPVTKTVDLLGTGTTATLDVTPTSIDFGTAKVNVLSTEQTVTISNAGTGTLHVLAVMFGGKDGASFQQTNGPKMGFDVPSNGSVTLGVSCSPKNIGALTATLDIGADIGSKQVALTCTGVAPQIALSPTMIDFGNVDIGQVSAMQAVTLSNNGTDDLHISSFVISGANVSDFASADFPSPLPATVKAGASVTFHMNFAPSQHAAESATATVVSDDPLMPNATIALAGNGLQANVDVSPLMLDFGMIPIGMSKPLDVVLTNSGDNPITVKTATLSGGAAASYSDDFAGNVMLAVGQSTTVHVTFKPTTAAKADASLAFQFDSGLQPATVSLTGQGVGAALSVTPTTVTFGSVGVGLASNPQMITLRNSGTVALEIDTVMASDPQFAVDLSLTNKKLNPGATTTFRIVYNPTAEGPASATIPITLKGQTMPIATVQASGSGMATMGNSGCKCEVGARPGSRAPALFAIALLAVALFRRRFRR